MGARQKWNWVQLKNEYMLSPAPTVQDFLRSKAMPLNGHTEVQTKGWTEEKNILLTRRTRDIQKHELQKLKDKYRIDTEELYRMKKLIFNLDSSYLNLLARMLSEKKEHQLSQREANFVKLYTLAGRNMKAVAERILLELGEPTKRLSVMDGGGDPMAGSLSGSDKVKLIEVFLKWGRPFLKNGSSGKTYIPEKIFSPQETDEGSGGSDESASA